MILRKTVELSLKHHEILKGSIVYPIILWIQENYDVSHIFIQNKLCNMLSCHFKSHLLFEPI